MRTSDSVLWKILKFFRLNKVYRTLFRPLLPESWNDKIASVTINNAFIPLVIEDEITPLFKSAWERLQKEGSPLGDYLEFGVSYGTSLKCMHNVLSKLHLDNARLFGFDSFEGLPESAAYEDEGYWRPGEFASSLEQTKKHLTDKGVDWNRTFLVKGWFDKTLTLDTLSWYNITKASVIMIDCDIYSSSITALNFCAPLIRDHAIIFFDDWKDDITFGEYKAFSEFLAANPQFKSESIGQYKPMGKVFHVSRSDV